MAMNMERSWTQIRLGFLWQRSKISNKWLLPFTKVGTCYRLESRGVQKSVIMKQYFCTTEEAVWENLNS